MSEQEPPTQTPPAASEPVAKPAEAANAPAPAARRTNKYFPVKPMPRSQQVGLAPVRDKNRMMWILVYAMTALVVGLGYFVTVGLLTNRNFDEPPGPVKLGKPFFDQEDFCKISPPINWVAEDRIEGTTVIFVGPPQKDFRPSIFVCRTNGVGNLEFYLKEYKLKLEHETPTLKWISEKQLKLANRNAVRLEYEYMDDSDKKNPEHQFKMRCVQWVIDDNMVFYRITGSATANTFDKFLPKFEASAETFTIVPPVSGKPKVFQD